MNYHADRHSGDLHGIRIYLAFILAFTIFLPVALAKEDSPIDTTLSEDIFLNELPLVLGVTRLAQPKSETPAAVTVIDRKMIEASGVRSIPDLFRLVPGMQVAYRRGNRTHYTYHGLNDQSSQRMQVLIDGRSVYTPLFGGIFLDEQPIVVDDIERIEIVRGSNAAAYGTNSVFGIINIVTRDPLQVQGTYTKFTSGSHNIFDNVFRHGFLGDAHRTRVSLGYISDDGIDSLPDTLRSPFLDLRSDIRLNTRDQLQLAMGYRQLDSEDGFYNNILLPPHDVRIITHYQQLRWSRNMGPNQALKIQLFHNYRDNGEAFVSEPIPLGALGSQRIQIDVAALEDRYDLELEHTTQINPNWRLVWGSGVRSDRVDSKAWFSTTNIAKNTSYRLFTNAEWRATSRTIINAGAMVEKSDLADTSISPRLSLNYHINNNHTFRIVGSRAERSPVLFEEQGNLRLTFFGVILDQYYLAIGGLKPEIMESVELGYFFKMFASNLMLDIRLSHDRLSRIVTEFITTSTDLNDGLALSTRNEGYLKIFSIDTEMSWRFSRHTALNIGLSIMHPEGSVPANDATVEAQDRISTVPNYSFSTMYNWQFRKNWSVSAIYYSVDDMRWLGGNKVDGYGRFDIRIAHKFKINGQPAEISLTGQNAINDDYIEFDQQSLFSAGANPENISGRRLFASFALKIN